MIEPVQKNDEFVKDFHDADKVTGAIHVWWLGLSTFLIKWDGIGLLTDPYLSDTISQEREGTDEPATRISDRVVDPLKLEGVDYVLCSGADRDRFDSETLLELRAANPNLKLIVPAGIAAEVEEKLGKAGPPVLSVNAGTYTSVGPFNFHGINASTPKIRRDADGNSFDLGYVILFGQFSIYYSGKTTWHQNLVKEARRWALNLAMLPINGNVTENGPDDTLNGFEAAALSKAISASLTIPCHYDVFEEGNPTTEEFENCSKRLAARHRIMKLGQRMTMGPVTDPSAGKAPPSEEYSADWKPGY